MDSGGTNVQNVSKTVIFILEMKGYLQERNVNDRFMSCTLLKIYNWKKINHIFKMYLFLTHQSEKKIKTAEFTPGLSNSAVRENERGTALRSVLVPG